jgi:hypothetical protein
MDIAKKYLFEVMIILLLCSTIPITYLMFGTETKGYVIKFESSGHIGSYNSTLPIIEYNVNNKVYTIYGEEYLYQLMDEVNILYFDFCPKKAYEKNVFCLIGKPLIHFILCLSFWILVRPIIIKDSNKQNFKNQSVNINKDLPAEIKIIFRIVLLIFISLFSIGAIVLFVFYIKKQIGIIPLMIFWLIFFLLIRSLIKEIKKI